MFHSRCASIRLFPPPTRITFICSCFYAYFDCFLSRRSICVVISARVFMSSKPSVNEATRYDKCTATINFKKLVVLCTARYSMACHENRSFFLVLDIMRVHYHLHYDIFTKHIITRNIECDKHTQNTYTWRNQLWWLFFLSLGMFWVARTLQIQNFYGFRSVFFSYIFHTHSLSVSHFFCSFVFPICLLYVCWLKLKLSTSERGNCH